jgi:cytochrome d ubiquinol oxidase subunit I
VPSLLSFLATGKFDGPVEGINEIKASLREAVRNGRASRVFSPSYTPDDPV